jgi:hypothetical protein
MLEPAEVKTSFLKPLHFLDCDQKMCLSFLVRSQRCARWVLPCKIKMPKLTIITKSQH